MKPKAKDRGGRPRTNRVKTGEKVQIGVRITPRLRGLLEKAAETGGRSLTQEAEVRLERSFDRQDTSHEILQARYGRQLAALLMVLGEAALGATLVCSAANSALRDKTPAIPQRALEDSLEDPWTAQSVKNAIEAILHELTGQTTFKLPEEMQRAMFEKVGIFDPGGQMALEVLSEVKARKFEPAPWAAEALHHLLSKEDGGDQ